MTKIRVYELAREVNMTNKMLLEKLKDMNVSAKSHMSVLDDQTASGVKDVLSGEKSEVVIEKRVRGTVIRRRRKPMAKKPLEPQEAAEPTELPPAVSEKPDEEKVVKLVVSEEAKAEAKETQPEEAPVEAKPKKAKAAK